MLSMTSNFSDKFIYNLHMLLYTLHIYKSIIIYIIITITNIHPILLSEKTNLMMPDLFRIYIEIVEN